MKKILLLLILTACFSCEDNDFDYSIVEPVYNRHFLSELSVDGERYASYIWNLSNQRLDTILFYQNEQITQWEIFNYRDDMLVERRLESERGLLRTVSYFFDERRQLIRNTSCISGEPCITYTYFRSPELICGLDSLIISSESFVDRDGDKYELRTTYSYSNFGNCSHTAYTSIVYPSLGYRVRTETEIVEKSVEQYINPFFHIYPEDPPYIDWNVLRFDNSVGKLSSERYVQNLETNASLYPTLMSYVDYNPETGEEVLMSYQFTYQ